MINSSIQGGPLEDLFFFSFLKSTIINIFDLEYSTSTVFKIFTIEYLDTVSAIKITSKSSYKHVQKDLICC